MELKKIAASIFFGLTLFLLSATFSFAKADDLVIMDDGGVILYVTNNVLADSTKANEEKKPTVPVPHPAPAKAVPLVPAHTESTVKISPPINDDKKIQVTITTPAPVQQKISNPTQANPASIPNTVVTRTVDQVVAKGAAGQTVYSIKSEQAHQLTINQEETKVKTDLSLQIDTISHALSVSASSQSTEPVRVSVLPKEAIQGIINKGILDNKTASRAQITLTKDLSGISYTVNSEKSGKLFGIVQIKAPGEVQLSAQTGKIIPTPKDTILNFFGSFVR